MREVVFGFLFLLSVSMFVVLSASSRVKPTVLQTEQKSVTVEMKKPPCFEVKREVFYWFYDCKPS